MVLGPAGSRARGASSDGFRPGISAAAARLRGAIRTGAARRSGAVGQAAADLGRVAAFRWVIRGWISRWAIRRRPAERDSGLQPEAAVDVRRVRRAAARAGVVAQLVKKPAVVVAQLAGP